MKALCQICGEVYAIVNIDTLRYPLTGAMFGSPDPFHGAPAPFAASLDWTFMRCPYGRIHRPMVQDDIVITDQGVVRLPKDGGAAFIDPTTTAEVDRHSIGDRVIQVSDEDAERVTRAAISIGESRQPGFVCPTCGKECKNAFGLTGHKRSHGQK